MVVLCFMCEDYFWLFWREVESGVRAGGGKGQEEGREEGWLSC